MSLAERVAAFCAAQRLEGTIGVVAVSGGADSVALAHLLLALLRQGTLRQLVLAHLNHQLRGADSDADAAFVVALAQSWSAREPLALGVETHAIDVADRARTARANLEATARRERYAWLAQVARTAGAAWVATGHTADDQAETVLFRLLRGSGLQGLAGMPARRPLEGGVDLVRPLLDVRRRDLLDYLREQGQPYREDATNLDPRFTRNRLRHELIPLLQAQYQPALVEVLCRLATQADEVHADLSRRADELLHAAELPRAGARCVLGADALTSQPAFLVREVYRLLWRREGWPLSEMGFDEWQRLVAITAGQGDGGDFPGQVHARRQGHVVQIEKR